MIFEELSSNLRYSCRSFQERAIEKADLDKILEAGRIAPTATNAQPQRIVVINSREGMEKLATVTRYTFNAPAALIICYDSANVWVRDYDGKDSGDVGYPDEKGSKPYPVHWKRKGLEETVVYESF